MQNSKEFISRLKELNSCFSSSNSICQSEFLNENFVSMFYQEDVKQRLELLQNLLENKKPSKKNSTNDNLQTSDRVNQTIFIDTCLENENTRQTIISILWQMLLVDVKDHFRLNYINHDTPTSVAKYTSINITAIIETVKKDNLHKNSLDYLLFKSLKNFILSDKSIFEISSDLLNPTFDWESVTNDNDELKVIQEMIDNSFEYIIGFMRDEFKAQLINLDFFQYFLHTKTKSEKSRLVFLGVINDQMDILINEIRNSVGKYNKIKNILTLLIKYEQISQATINKKVLYPQLVFVLSYIFAEKIVYSIFRHMSSADNILAELKKQFDSDLIAFEMISSYFLDMTPNIAELKENIQKKYNYYVNMQKFNFNSDWDLFEKLVNEYKEKNSLRKGQQSLNM